MPRGFPKNGVNRGRFKKGQKILPAIVEKMRLKLRGNKNALGKRWRLSDETRKKIGESKKGNKNWLGRHHTEETRQKKRLLFRENNPAWQGGVTPLKRQIRNCFFYRQWRSDIFKRDDFMCQSCGKRGGRIEADHYPKKFSVIFDENKIESLEQAENCEELWNLNNGRTLCFDCHNETKKICPDSPTQ